MSLRLAVLGILILALTGCVAGNSHTFDYVPAERTDVGKGTVVLLFAVDDQRPYVVSGDEPAFFVGEQRNGYGMPFNVTTENKRPFAEVVHETVKRDLEAAGFRVTASPEKGASDVAGVVKRANARRALVVVMREFKSDTFNNINFDYDFDATVYDQNGRELAKSKVAGEDQIEGSLMNPAKAAREKVPAEFYKKIHELVTGNPKIVKALVQ